MSAGKAFKELVEAGVDLITGVPDSLLAPLHLQAARHPDIRYVPACDEATAVALAAGARLAGARSIVLMENSGLRRACETLSRFTLSHRLHVAMLVARRGAFGERNWWGIAHEETMHPHLRMLSVATDEVDSVDGFGDQVRAAFAMLATGQRSVALVANPAFIAQMRSD